MGALDGWMCHMDSLPIEGMDDREKGGKLRTLKWTGSRHGLRAAFEIRRRFLVRHPLTRSSLFSSLLDFHIGYYPTSPYNLKEL